MIGDRHRRIIFTSITAVHVACLLRTALAQPMSPLAPSSSEMQHKTDPSRGIVFAVLLSAFFFTGFLSVYLRNCSASHSRSFRGNLRRSADGSRLGGLDDAVVESFPLFAYSSVKEWKIGLDAFECAICLGEFEDNEMLRLIPRCNHVFHTDCIDAWLYSHANCPVCRAKLAPESHKLGEDELPATGSIAAPENTEIDRVRDHVLIDIEVDQTGESEAIDRQRRSGIGGKFPRSNSTGHSLAQVRDTTERYTLRLPDDASKRIMSAARGRRLKRTRSYDGGVSAAEGSTRRGWRSGGEESSRGRGHRFGSGERSDRVSWTDRWGLLVSKMGAVRTPNDNGEAIIRVSGDGPLK